MVERLLTWVAGVGEVGLFGARGVRDIFRPPFELGEVSHQIYEIGSRSTPLILISGLALGAVAAMHSIISMSRFGAQSLTPEAVSIGMVRILGPLVTGLLASGRIGAGIGAELGGMRVTRQIDALEALAVDSFKYLVATRILACVIALPVLTLIADFAGIAGGMFLDKLLGHVSFALFLNNAFQVLSLADFLPSVFKTVVFGLIIGSVSCFLGYNATGGASGVGRASTRSVVACSLLLLVVDIILVKLIAFWNL